MLFCLLRYEFGENRSKLGSISFYWYIFLIIFPSNISVCTKDFRNMMVNWISHWAFLFHCLLVAFKSYEHSERQENPGLKLSICPMYPEDRHMLCGKEERCRLYFPCSVLENFFPKGARRDEVSSGRSCFWSYNFKIDPEERVFLHTSCMPGCGFLICMHKPRSYVVTNVPHFTNNSRSTENRLAGRQCFQRK